MIFSSFSNETWNILVFMMYIYLVSKIALNSSVFLEHKIDESES